MVAHKDACHTLSKAFEINEDLVQILLMLGVRFTWDSKVEDLFCDAPSGSEPKLFFSCYLFDLEFNGFQDDFQHDVSRKTDTFRVVLGWAYRGLTSGFLLLQNFSVPISVSPHVCFILVLILISVFLR